MFRVTPANLISTSVWRMWLCGRPHHLFGGSTEEDVGNNAVAERTSPLSVNMSIDSSSASQRSMFEWTSPSPLYSLQERLHNAVINPQDDYKLSHFSSTANRRLRTTSLGQPSSKARPKPDRDLDHTSIHYVPSAATSSHSSPPCRGPKWDTTDHAHSKSPASRLGIH